MPLRLRSALPLLLMLACSSPKPPESTSPEPPESSTPEPAATDPEPGETSLEPAVTGPLPAAAADAPAVETLFVNSARVACEGEGVRECLQVRNSEGEAWRNLYATIEGFEYEPSHTYELRVEVTRIAKPPSDAPSLKYKLQQVVSKRKVSK